MDPHDISIICLMEWPPLLYWVKGSILTFGYFFLKFYTTLNVFTYIIPYVIPVVVLINSGLSKIHTYGYVDIKELQYLFTIAATNSLVVNVLKAFIIWK